MEKTGQVKDKAKNRMKLKKENLLETKDKIKDSASTIIRRGRECAHCEKKIF